VGAPPRDDEDVVVGEGWAGGVDVEDLGTDMYLVPSLFVYLAVVFGVGDAAATAATGRLLLEGIPRKRAL
jgi:hypothetical protein